MHWVTARVTPFLRLRQLFWDVPRALIRPTAFLRIIKFNAQTVAIMVLWRTDTKCQPLRSKRQPLNLTNPQVFKIARGDEDEVILEVMDGLLSSRSTNAVLSPETARVNYPQLEQLPVLSLWI